MFFFSCVKTKYVCETCFWPFLEFFSRTKYRFHADFFLFLHAHFFAFTGTFLKFSDSRKLFCYVFLSRVLFSFSRALFPIFCTQVFFFFKQVKKNTVERRWVVATRLTRKRVPREPIRAAPFDIFKRLMESDRTFFSSETSPNGHRVMAIRVRFLCSTRPSADTGTD